MKESLGFNTVLSCLRGKPWGLVGSRGHLLYLLDLSGGDLEGEVANSPFSNRWRTGSGFKPPSPYNTALVNLRGTGTWPKLLFSICHLGHHLYIVYGE